MANIAKGKLITGFVCVKDCLKIGIRDLHCLGKGAVHQAGDIGEANFLFQK